MVLNNVPTRKLLFCSERFKIILQFPSVDSFSVEDDTNPLSIIFLSVGMMSLVITFMGIKLKWFRHRLTFDHENQVASPVLLRTTSVTEIRENCARGIYRQSFDSEALSYREDLPPQRPAGNEKIKSKSM